MSSCCELQPGEVLADRYDPADENTRPEAVEAAQLAAWEADPWF